MVNTARARRAGASLAGLLVLALAGRPAGAREQVCDTDHYPLSTPEARFEDRGDGTLLDRQTRLLWLRCALGQQWSAGACAGQPSLLSWSVAHQQLLQINAQGTHFFNDWRIPGIQELASIAERQCHNPRINLTLFPGTPPAPFWSSTLRQPANADGMVLVLGFGEDGVQHDAQEGQHYVRLVRDGP